MKARNKWHGRIYEVLEMTDRKVKMQREDGSQFTIDRAEFNFSYIVLDK